MDNIKEADRLERDYLLKCQYVAVRHFQTALSIGKLPEHITKLLSVLEMPAISSAAYDKVIEKSQLGSEMTNTETEVLAIAVIHLLYSFRCRQDVSYACHMIPGFSQENYLDSKTVSLIYDICYQNSLASRRRDIIVATFERNRPLQLPDLLTPQLLPSQQLIFR